MRSKSLLQRHNQSPSETTKARRRERHVRMSAAASDRPTPPSERTGSWRRWLVLALVGVAALGGSWAFCELVLWNRLPAALVGKWVVVEGPREYEAATFDFFRGGAMKATVNVQGNAFVINATVRVEGNTIYSTSRRPQTGEETTHALTIRTLNERELVVEDEQGKIMRLWRAESR
jgi:uncharacterized protein (TIGR03066 family)